MLCSLSSHLCQYADKFLADLSSGNGDEEPQSFRARTWERSIPCSYCEAINAICAVWLNEQFEMNH